MTGPKSELSCSSLGSSGERDLSQETIFLIQMGILEHASSCESPTCKSRKCHKMKQYLDHVAKRSCEDPNDCNVCVCIQILVQRHSLKCNDSCCSVPGCLKIRQLKRNPMRGTRPALRRQNAVRHMESASRGKLIA